MVGHGSNLAVAVLGALCIDLNLINKMNGRRREAALAEPQRRTSLAADGLQLRDVTIFNAPTATLQNYNCDSDYIPSY